VHDPTANNNNNNNNNNNDTISCSTLSAVTHKLQLKNRRQNKLHAQFSDFILNTGGEGVQQSERVAEHQFFLFLLRILRLNTEEEQNR
jgi:hypothetical protein